MIRRNVISSLATAAFLMGCGGGLRVDTDFDPQADFASMETYAWAQRTATGDDDPRVYNALVAARLKRAARPRARSRQILPATPLPPSRGA